MHNKIVNFFERCGKKGLFIVIGTTYMYGVLSEKPIMLTPEEFFESLDPQPKFRIGEKVHLGYTCKHGAGVIGELASLDIENDEAVINVANVPSGIRSNARFLSKLH